MSFLPSKTLLWATFGLAVLAAVAGPMPEFTPFWLVALLIVLLCALTDLALSLRSTTFPKVSAPAIVRLTKDREGSLPLAFANPQAFPARFRFALGLPAAFTSPTTEFALVIPAESQQSRMEWKTTAHLRGTFKELVACAEGNSKFGLWQLRTRQPLSCEVRVYPNLLTEGKALSALFLARGQYGARVQHTVGRGREFEKLRDYQTGDGFDEVSWKATAKRGRPITKVFQAERTQEVCVVIDASRLSARSVTLPGGSTVTTLERYITATMVLLLAAQKQGDRFGLAVYDDRVRSFMRAAQGTGHYGACRDAIYGFRSSNSTPDVAEIIRHLKARLRRRTLLFFLTDLTDPILAEDFARYAPLLSRQHLVFVNQLRYPGMNALFSAPEVQDESEIYTRFANHVRWSESRALAQKLKPEGVTVGLLENEALSAQLVTQYLKVKQRQAL